jgi:hypothetical protein
MKQCHNGAFQKVAPDLFERFIQQASQAAKIAFR